MSDEYIDDPEIRQQVADALQRAERVSQWQRSLDQMTQRTSSPRGEVTVEVDPAGRLLACEFSAAIAGIDPNALGKLVMATVAEARRDVGKRVMVGVDDLFGAGTPAAKAMEQQYLKTTQLSDEATSPTKPTPDARPYLLGS